MAAEVERQKADSRPTTGQRIQLPEYPLWLNQTNSWRGRKWEEQTTLLKLVKILGWYSKEERTKPQIIYIALLLKHRNTSKVQQAKEITQPNNLELRVVPLVEHNSNSLLPSSDKAGVVLSQHKKEVNFSDSNTLAPCSFPNK